jgi:hypothetical protein
VLGLYLKNLVAFATGQLRFLTSAVYGSRRYRLVGRKLLWQWSQARLHLVDRAAERRALYKALQAAARDLLEGADTERLTLQLE